MNIRFAARTKEGVAPDNNNHAFYIQNALRALRAWVEDEESQIVVQTFNKLAKWRRMHHDQSPKSSTLSTA